MQIDFFFIQAHAKGYLNDILKAAQQDPRLLSFVTCLSNMLFCVLLLFGVAAVMASSC